MMARERSETSTAHDATGSSGVKADMEQHQPVGALINVTVPHDGLLMRREEISQSEPSSSSPWEAGSAVMAVDVDLSPPPTPEEQPQARSSSCAAASTGHGQGVWQQLVALQCTPPSPSSPIQEVKDRIEASQHLWVGHEDNNPSSLSGNSSSSSSSRSSSRSSPC